MTSTFYPQLVEVLRSAGCVFVRQGKGSHEIWQSNVARMKLAKSGTFVSSMTRIAQSSMRATT